jgi:hypothetical protein
MKKIINFISTRILKYRGITQETFLFNECKKIECITCGKTFPPTKENVRKYMFGHINCPKVYGLLVFGFKRTYIK